MTDEDVENELTAARKKNGRLIDVEDGAIEDGDKHYHRLHRLH